MPSSGELVSYVSLALATASLVWNIFHQRSIYRLQLERNRDEKDAKKKASLTVTLTSSGKSNYRLVLDNSGHAPATNIRMELNGRPVSECNHVPRDSMPEVLGSKSQYTLPIAVSFDFAPPFLVKILWDDDYAKDREYQSSVSF